MPDFSISVRRPFFASAKRLLLSKKFKIFLNYFIGPVIFIWLAYSIYKQLQQQTDVHQSWIFIRTAVTGPQAWKVMLALLLLPLHWAIEMHKWKRLIGHIQQISLMRALRAILFGQALALNTPNRIGDPLGRSVFLDEGKRLKGIALSVVGNMSHTIVTFVVGLLSLLFLRLNIDAVTDRPAGVSLFWYNGFVLLVTLGTLLFIIVYYNVSWVIKRLEKIRVIAKYRFLVEELENLHWKELTGILLLSASRYVIYVTQYVLLLQVFEVHVSVINVICLTGVMFLVLAAIPSISLVELGFRGKVGLVLFGLLSSNTIGIVAAMAGIWIINLFLPAIAGSMVMLGFRIFRNKKE
jgi:hypothetical protein